LLFGALIAILGGSFTFIPETQKMTFLFLIILGAFIGIMNISMEEEHGFLVAGGALIIASLAINSLLSNYLLLDVIARILNNFIIFIAPACIVVAFRVIIEYASQSEWSFKKEERIAVQLYKHLNHKERIWDSIVLFAVAITFILLVLQLFFKVDGYSSMIIIVDVIVIAIFFADLVVLYRRAQDFKKFMKTNWMDIIAVIPLGMVFRITKLIRFIRILEHMSWTHKASKINKVNRPAKFFSESRDFEERKRKR
ncbi:MAG: hypothetical protein KKE20_01210, partial [Nanoarchaeota archaeon]|nr:hypothetical protein [Nanoarchaeota archaeon]